MNSCGRGVITALRPVELEDWTAFPEVITGEGNAITRFYSTREEFQEVLPGGEAG